MMFETLLRLWNDGAMTEQGLKNAVIKGWITEKQKNEIMTEQDNNVQKGKIN